MSKWQDWHQAYADPDSALSGRLAVVRSYLARALGGGTAPIRLISLCAGDGRDAIPMIAESDRQVEALLVELEPELAAAARERAADHNLAMTVRTADAGHPSSFADHAPASILLLCGIFGNISDADIEQTIATIPSYLSRDAVVIWTRGDHEVDGKDAAVPPSERVRKSFIDTGYEELDFASPADAGFRVGMHRWPHPTRPAASADRRLFTFLW